MTVFTAVRRFPSEPLKVNIGSGRRCLSGYWVGGFEEIEFRVRVVTSSAPDGERKTGG